MYFQVEKEIGEKRIISFHGVGLSVAPAISLSKLAASYESSEEVGSIDAGLLLSWFICIALCTYALILRRNYTGIFLAIQISVL